MRLDVRCENGTGVRYVYNLHLKILGQRFVVDATSHRDTFTFRPKIGLFDCNNVTPRIIERPCPRGGIESG